MGGLCNADGGGRARPDESRPSLKPPLLTSHRTPSAAAAVYACAEHAPVKDTYLSHAGVEGPARPCREGWPHEGLALAVGMCKANSGLALWRPKARRKRGCLGAMTCTCDADSASAVLAASAGWFTTTCRRRE